MKHIHYCLQQMLKAEKKSTDFESLKFKIFLLCIWLMSNFTLKIAASLNWQPSLLDERSTQIGQS